MRELLRVKLLVILALCFTGGGDHSQHHDRHPSQSKVRRWSLLSHNKLWHHYDLE